MGLERSFRAAVVGYVPLAVALALALSPAAGTPQRSGKFLGATSVVGGVALPDDDRDGSAIAIVCQPPIVFTFLFALVAVASGTSASRLGNELRRSRAPPFS